VRALAMLAFVIGASSCRCPIEPARLHAAQLRHGHELLASIKRTACFGSCPAYELRVYRDGTVEYKGVSSVQTMGAAAGRVSDEDLAALDDLFIRNGYVDLDSSYESPSCCDAPTVYTTYSPGGCKKSVAHYLGADDVPKALFDIEAGFERIVHVERFIGEKTGGPAAVFHP
jgi:hypothetical protein